MTDNLQIFRDFDQIVRNQYDTIPLRDIGNINIGKENSVTFFSRIVRSKQNLKPSPIQTSKFMTNSYLFPETLNITPHYFTFSNLTLLTLPITGHIIRHLRIDDI